MASSDYSDLIDLAKEKFHTGDYKSAEPLFEQILLREKASSEIYQMLGTIHYEKGRFSRAIQFFKKALEINPSDLEASVGLSIILNDLGRYEEGQEVFEKAQAEYQRKEKEADPFLKEQIAFKHEELGDLYLQNHMPSEGIEEYSKALRFSESSSELTLKLTDGYIEIHQPGKAIAGLKKLLRKDPADLLARLKMGSIYYQSNSVTEALEQWENVLLRDPKNQEAQKMIKEACARRLDLELR